MLGYYFVKARVAYYSQIIEKLPKGRIGINRSRNKTVVRSYRVVDGKKVHTEHYFDSEPGQRILKQIELRNQYEELLSRYTNIYGKLIQPNSKNINNTPKGRITMLPASFYAEAKRNAKPENAKNDDEYPYTYDGIRMRSRAEVDIAQVMDGLDLKFVYEPRIAVEDWNIAPDFLIYIPELDCCIILEYLGMFDDENYIYKNMKKVANYMKNRLKIGIDVILIYGSEKIMPDPLSVKTILESTLEEIARNLNV